MPPTPIRKALWRAWFFLGALISGFCILGFFHPQMLPFVVALGIIVGAGTIWETRFRRRLAASRATESICNFARSFDRRKSDTWIVRAVYEELSRFLSVDGKAIAVRAKDRCDKDLKIDPEDLDDLVLSIAFRAGRCPEATKQNPYYGKVQTVRDIVAFLEHQPQITAEILKG